MALVAADANLKKLIKDMYEAIDKAAKDPKRQSEYKEALKALESNSGAFHSKEDSMMEVLDQLSGWEDSVYCSIYGNVVFTFHGTPEEVGENVVTITKNLEPVTARFNLAK